jgi:hypothetical protein
MEAWRLIAAALVGAGGVVLVLLTMAKIRERRGATNGQVALAGAITFTVLVLLCVLIVTVLTPWLAWSAVVVVGVTVTVMMLAS